MLKISLKLLGGIKDSDEKSITGSSAVLTVKNGFGTYNILIDCGLHQGTENDELYNKEFGFDPSILNCAILTHAHIDHCGRFPFIVNKEFFKNPFKGKIYTHHLTKLILPIMLNDAANIQMSEAKEFDQKSKVYTPTILPKQRRLHQRFPPEDQEDLEDFFLKAKELKKDSDLKKEVLYTTSEVKKVLHLTEGLEYKIWKQILPGISIKLYNAAHVLGSTMIVVRLEDSSSKNKRYKYLLFSGDLGRVRDSLALGKPDIVKEKLSFVMMESTYGGRIHETRGVEIEQMRFEILKCIRRNSTILAPAFAYQRVSDILEVLSKMDGVYGNVKIYLDSKLAYDLFQIYKTSKTYAFLNDIEIEIIQNKSDLERFRRQKGAKILLSSSGMVNAGSVMKHLPEILPIPNNRVFLLGYMAENTIGRQLLEGKKLIEIPVAGRIEVASKIVAFKSFSGHADEKDLIEIFKSLKIKQDVNFRLFINHGEADGSALALKNAFVRKNVLNKEKITIPKSGHFYQIL
ncbi:MAG: MBL fold metallo-hydrolase [Candidatus Gracilibacteria bacterium]|nr:MBL fold metallo-hydrolase [Candidatus Gracilibacteria bacterium]